ncbi:MULTISPECIES: DUF3240 family protein [unclassified Oceanobacter]|jgi:hypothetical protein|uniref:DUF3240 family protein n=1 Tax=unclassified Oceanobacter TaxID=2620260 RepID=UPI0026E1860D|nr:MULTISPECIES: DUF3240 family protein [unclassified Oceanobacter]MDO6682307.1 DUF3240 family protein [Oceanobacter sp. 5_MG-2023]MDP2506057.1 DUF3240 family protein [Oceanobacter sp. 3_MG-2023]MDP2547636.1 DUF3240 family protein [Oceanobacter sp. 4_MG-2023]MDP2609010.1 DUF3240 family protein [Oceanobacter sp. 1_MG-2023]MDP2612005.1 DUF3240 family protein [Oceanobacter sp. 2_MG-2023]
MSATETNTQPHTLLTLSLPPRQADVVTDWLLQQGLPGFSSWTGWGHSNRLDQLSISEQIQGKQNRTFISLHLSEPQYQAVLENLRQRFSSFDIHYWVQALLASGRLTQR